MKEEKNINSSEEFEARMNEKPKLCHVLISTDFCDVIVDIHENVFFVNDDAKEISIRII